MLFLAKYLLILSFSLFFSSATIAALNKGLSREKKKISPLLRAKRKKKKRTKKRKVKKKRGKKSAQVPQQPWILGDLVQIVDKEPLRVIKFAEKLFNSKRVKLSSQSKQLIYEWQHRYAMVQALSHMYTPYKKVGYQSFQKRAKKIIEKALLNDPALLVRDGAVESIRRIVKMRPLLAPSWKLVLEKAFMQRKNVLKGEGFFIRETILQVMKEGALPISKTIKTTAKKDKNPRVSSFMY